MVKFDNDYAVANSDAGIKLDKDDPAARKSVLGQMIKAGCEEILIEMMGVREPIPNYGVK
jgi:hypothetical protein